MKDYFANLTSNSGNCAETGGDVSMLSSKKASEVSIPMTTEDAVIMEVVSITKECIQCFTEYAKCREHEITERKRIVETLHAMQYQIDAQKEVYMKELDMHFEERKYLYDMAMEAQEAALESGDKEMLQVCYNFILNVYNKSLDKEAIPFLSNSSNDIL